MKKAKEYVASFSDQELAEFIGESGKVDPSWQKVFDSALGSCHLRLYSLGQLVAYLKMKTRLAVVLLVGCLIMMIALATFASYLTRSGLVSDYDIWLAAITFIISFGLGEIWVTLWFWLRLRTEGKRWRDLAEISWYRSYFSELEAATECSFISALEKSYNEVLEAVWIALKKRVLEFQERRETLDKSLEHSHGEIFKQALAKLSEEGDELAKLYQAARKTNLCLWPVDRSHYLSLRSILAMAQHEAEDAERSKSGSGGD